MWTKVLLAAVAFVVVDAADTFSRDDFPPDFFFGVSTSAFQVEGAADEDGRTPSIFDTFAYAGNMTGEYGSRSTDEYHKYKEDVQLMAKMGVNAYRFCISWSRLIPNGKGPVNPKGLEYYNNLINELISQGIQPHVTLHHSDLPQALEDEYEGWLSERVVKDFTAYADVCFREFGDRVKYWTTMNEANAFLIGGYDIGFLPPQRCSTSPFTNCSRGNTSTEPYIAGHIMLLAHASAATLYRKKYQDKQRGFIGINMLTFGIYPLTNSSEDLSAAQRAQDFFVGWFLDPIMFGDYPEIMKKNAGSRLPSFTKAESNLVKGSIDFLGINFYNALYAKDSPISLEVEDRDILADMAVEFRLIQNDTSSIEGLQKVIESLKQSYGNLPIYIYENGQATLRNSSLDDWPRVKYLHGYIGGVLDALRNGLNVKGYFVWSFLDLFELLGGYQISYGLYYVDLNDPILKRQPKLSAKWYSRFLHGRNMVMDPKITKNLEKNASMLSLHNAT